MRETRGPRRWVGFVRRRERSLVGLMTVGSVILLGALAAPKTRIAGLAVIQKVIDRRNSRWDARLGAAEALLKDGQLEAAERALLALDAAHPARMVRHGRDKQRERILLRLAEAHEGQHHRGRALATYDRLVAFDSLNYLNHFALGSAYQRLSQRWSVPPEARDAYATALRLNPNHLPSLRGYVGYYYDRGEFGEVVAAFERYHRAILVQPLTLHMPGWQALGHVPVSGLEHRLEFPRQGLAGTGETLSIDPGGLPTLIDSVVFLPVARVGHPGVRPSVRLERLTETTFTLRPGESEAGTIRVHVKVFKPMDPVLWDRIARSYRNLLDDNRLGLLSSQTLVMSSPEEADRALAQLPWARNGRLLGPDEYPF